MLSSLPCRLLSSYNSSNSCNSFALDQLLSCTIWEFACSASTGERQVFIQPSSSSKAWAFHRVDVSTPVHSHVREQLSLHPYQWREQRMTPDRTSLHKGRSYNMRHQQVSGVYKNIFQTGELFCVMYGIWWVIQQHLLGHYPSCSEYPKEMYFNWHKFMFLCWLGNELTDKLQADL